MIPMTNNERKLNLQEQQWSPNRPMTKESKTKRSRMELLVYNVSDTN